MKKILVIEDSHTVLKVLRRIINLESEFTGLYATNYAEAEKIVEENGSQIFAALADMNLPDAPNGEVVDFVLSKGIPTIVLTGSADTEKRADLFRKGIVDYVNKEGVFSYRYAVRLVDRIWRNQSVKVLVVDDSDTSRRHVASLLKLYRFNVLTANDGAQGIDVILANPDIKMLITDYNMPGMNGVELIRMLRNKHEKTDLVIIGLSGEGQLSAKFIKNGASDFLSKPFNREEFQCRVMHNIEAFEHVEQIRNIANRDYLTGAYNRRYFFVNAGQIYKSAKAEEQNLAVAVLDIDFFKLVNDNYGHDVGDGVLKYFTKILSQAFGKFLVARAGGEEFFVLMPGLSNVQACALVDVVRKGMAAEAVEVGNESLPITFSAGVSNKYCGSLDEQIKTADTLLYEAKEAGRNCVMGDASANSLMAVESQTS